MNNYVLSHCSICLIHVIVRNLWGKTNFFCFVFSSTSFSIQFASEKTPKPIHCFPFKMKVHIQSLHLLLILLMLIENSFHSSFKKSTYIDLDSGCLCLFPVLQNLCTWLINRHRSGYLPAAQWGDLQLLFRTKLAMGITSGDWTTDNLWLILLMCFHCFNFFVFLHCSRDFP